jgi:hypothetical protein
VQATVHSWLSLTPFSICLLPSPTIEPTGYHLAGELIDNHTISVTNVCCIEDLYNLLLEGKQDTFPGKCCLDCTAATGSVPVCVVKHDNSDELQEVVS